MADEWATVPKKVKVVKEKPAVVEAPKTVFAAGGKWGTNSAAIKSPNAAPGSAPAAKTGTAPAGNWRGKNEAGSNEKAAALANEYPVLYLPAGEDPAANLEALRKILSENTKRFVIRPEAKETHKFLLQPHTAADWQFEDTKTVPTAAYWEAVNVAFGNAAFTFQGTLTVLTEGLKLSEDVVQSFDVKGVEYFSGILERSFDVTAESRPAWESFTKNVAHNYRLVNDQPLVNKLRFVYGIAQEGSLYVVKHLHHKGSSWIDLLGDKPSLGEYSKYFTGGASRDQRALFHTCVQDILTSFKLTVESVQVSGNAGAFTTDNLVATRKAVESAPSPTGQTTTSPALVVHLKFEQIAPFLLKVVINKVEEEL